MTLPRSRTPLVLVGICGLAILLRIIGLAYGLPAVFNPDETPILNRALAFAKGDPNPHNFVYPSLYFYALFVWEGLFFVAGRVAGLFDSLAAFEREFFVDPSRHFLAARAFGVLCGTATVIAVYRVGQRLYDRATGLVAAAFLAVSPIAVRDSHYVKLDVPVTLMTVLAHAALARILVDREAAARRRTWLIAGLLAGLAVSTQYYVVFIGAAIVAVTIVDFTRTRSWRVTGPLFLWCALGTIVGFFAGTPFLLVDFQKALSDIAHVREVDIDRAVVGGAFTGVGAYVQILFRDAVGWPVALLAGAGTLLALALDWRRALLLVVFPLAFFAFIANTVPMSRYLNAILPFVVLAAAVATTWLARLAGRRANAAIAVVAALAIVPGLVGSLRTGLFIREADTRALAQAYVERQVQAGSSVLVQPHSVPLRQSREGLVEALRANIGSEASAPAKARMTLELDPFPQPAYRLIYLGDGGLDNDKIYVSPGAFSSEPGLAPLRRLGVGYVVLSDGTAPNPALAPLRAALAREGRRLAEFSPYRTDVSPAERNLAPPFMHNTAARIDPRLERPGPIVEVWSIGTAVQ
jgi:hypothetical protein